MVLSPIQSTPGPEDHDILHTNAVPSDEECDRIRSLLEGPLKDLVGVTEEIDRLQSLIDEAARKRDRLQQFIDAHLALVSPARRLPDDIVRDVFTAALPTTRNPTISSDEAPLLLCRICKSWRTIALTTPRLWASIHVVIPAPSKFDCLIDLLTTWLERSGTVPLEISMVYSRASDPDCDVSPILSTLSSASHRWKNMHLTAPISGASPLARLTSGDVPQLRSMGLVLLEYPSFTEDVTTDDVTDPMLLAFLATPSLRSVTFTGTYTFVDTPEAVSWGTLTHLNITDHLSCPTALVILSQCAALQTCKLYIGEFDTDNDSEPVARPVLQHFSLPHLSRLALSISQHRNISSSFFSHISVPELRSLSLECSFNIDLTRLFPSLISLERLRLDVEGLGCENLVAALANMPLLQELVLAAEPRSREQVEDPNTWHYWKSTEGDGEFLRHLTLPSALCPLLQRVDIHLSMVSDESLLRFVQSRTSLDVRGNHLCSVTATFHRLMKDDIRPCLQDAIANGLVVELSYMNGPEVPTYSPREGVVYTGDSSELDI